jgi:probable rRNA maturation factor
MIEVEIEDGAWTAALPDAEALALKAAQTSLTEARSSPSGGSPAEGREGGSRGADDGLQPPSPASPVLPPEGGDLGIAILLTSDEVLADLNQRFRHKDGPTNVLSFPAPATAHPHLGDIAVAFGVCAREAGEQGKRLEHHLMHLVAHGVLHLVGYDHQTESEAEDMEALERRVLAELGAPDPYQTTAPGAAHAG